MKILELICFSLGIAVGIVLNSLVVLVPSVLGWLVANFLLAPQLHTQPPSFLLVWSIITGLYTVFTILRK